MDKWNLIIDVAQCQGCNNCMLAAKDELVGNNFPGYSAPHAESGTGVIRIERVARGREPMVDAAYLPRMCGHCDGGLCLEAGADGAVRKRDDGIVIFDPVKAKGRRDLVEACPYGAVVWNDAQQLPQTWFFDAHLLDAGWAGPRCVGVCPTRAITAVKVSDAVMAQRVRSESLRVLSPEADTRPRVYYRHLDRVDRLFVGGGVEALIDGKVECVKDASIELYIEGRSHGRTLSDTFGDFRFGGICPGAGRGDVVATHSTLGACRIEFHVESQSIVLGPMALS